MTVFSEKAFLKHSCQLDDLSPERQRVCYYMVRVLYIAITMPCLLSKVLQIYVRRKSLFNLKYNTTSWSAWQSPYWGLPQ